MQAAILLAKLDIFDSEIALREQVAKRYIELLREQDSIKLPFVVEGNTSVYAQFTIQVDDREKVQAELKYRGVPSVVHYPIPLNKQAAVASDSYLPVGDALATRVLSLPMHPYLSEAELKAVADAVVAACGAGK